MHVLHSNAAYRWYLKKFLRKVDLVINSSAFNEKLTSEYDFLNGHTHDALFGSAALEQLHELTRSENKSGSKQKLGIDSTKVTVMIGYSGKEIHNHIPIMNCLKETEEFKNRLHILAPMTRGGNPAYIDKVRDTLEKSGYSYTLLHGTFLSDTDVARLRNATDMTLQLSEYDGFSRSIVECMGAGSILIYGDWLNYDDRLTQEGLKGIKVSQIRDITPKISGFLADPEKYQQDCISNQNNVSENNLWKNCINDWVKAYSD
jgi:glycosyltransferase involved in cell wall biosynthesis